MPQAEEKQHFSNFTDSIPQIDAELKDLSDVQLARVASNEPQAGTVMMTQSQFKGIRASNEQARRTRQRKLDNDRQAREKADREAAEVTMSKRRERFRADVANSLLGCSSEEVEAVFSRLWIEYLSGSARISEKTRHQLAAADQI